jgi:hypothetical protein
MSMGSSSAIGVEMLGNKEESMNLTRLEAQRQEQGVIALKIVQHVVYFLYVSG